MSPRMSDWGIATMGEGVFAVGRTRHEAVIQAGFATPHKRQTVSRGVYEYVSAEGSAVTVGRLRDLERCGFALPTGCPKSPVAIHSERSDGTCVFCDKRLYPAAFGVHPEEKK